MALQTNMNSSNSLFTHKFFKRQLWTSYILKFLCQYFTFSFVPIFVFLKSNMILNTRKLFIDTQHTSYVYNRSLFLFINSNSVDKYNHQSLTRQKNNGLYVWFTSPFSPAIQCPLLLPNPLWQMLSVLYPHPPALCQFSSYNSPLFFSSQELAVSTHGSFSKAGLWLLEQASSEHRETLKNLFSPHRPSGHP